jgi:GWxTD domain-containing protein
MTMRMPLVRFAAVLLLSLSAVAATAAELSAEHKAFGEGPATWIMTRDEMQQWKQIRTDDEAENFIQLFWARRDPTPGTYANEFKAEFENRVRVADKEFTDNPSKPGSMTERGRALILLGFPSNYNSTIRELSKMQNTDDKTTGGRQLGGKQEWLYEHDVAVQYGMPKIEIVFLEDPHTHVFHRDPQRPDFISAIPGAMKKIVVNPDLKTVPEWAKPQVISAVVEAPKKLSQQAAAAMAAPPVEPGLHKLVLVKDVMTIPSAQEKRDPFTNAVSASSFTKGDDLGYAFQYCGSADVLKLTITITGMSGGKKVRMVAPADDVTPDPMRAVPGCGMVRASIPLSDLTLQPGTYNFAVKLEDGATSYNLAQDFKIE